MRNRCFLVNDSPHVTVRRAAAIGDVIATTVVADKLARLGYDVTFQTLPAIQPLLRRHRNTAVVRDVGGSADVNLDGCYEKDPERTKRHFSEMFLASANKQLRARGIDLGPAVNCLATLQVTEQEKQPYLTRLEQFEKPWIFVCPLSQNWPNRTIPPYVWQEVARLVPGTKFWMGTADAPPGFQDPKIRSIDAIAVWLACADLLVSVDTGPLHIAAAVGCPAVAVEQASAPELHLSDQRDFVVVRHPALDCLNCQKDVCPKAEHIPPCQQYPPEIIAEAVNKRLRAFTSEDISAVIPIFRPPVDRLTKCIELVSPQVSEIIVTYDAGGVVPPGAPQGPKIRYVRHRRKSLGFGKNVNFGMRHANGRHILLMNDDVYLRPDAVSKLRECMAPDVGIVGHLLYYANGTIQHGGKYRNPGMRGWGHVDHRKYVPTITKPMETENVTAASILIRRQAFYDACGFNEEFFMYAEDDALCLQVRQKGYKIMYTPLASGIHLESQSSKERPDFHDRIKEGNLIFWRNWGWWIEANLNRVPGVF